MHNNMQDKLHSNMSKCGYKRKLSLCGFSMASGITSGLMVLILGLMATYYKIGTPYVHVLSSVYKGYGATVMGSFMGAGWAFLCGLIGGLIFASIYNLVLCMCPCRSCRSCHSCDAKSQKPVM